MKNKFYPRLFGGIIALGFGASPLQAATFTWDSLTGVGNDGVQDGSGLWIPDSTNFWNGTANGTPAKGTDGIVFGGSSGGHTVTISNGGALLNYSDAASSSSLTFSQNYTLAGLAAGDGIAAGNITVANGVTANISAVIRGGIGNSIGNRNWNMGAGSTLNLSGGGSIQRITSSAAGSSVVNLQSGSYDVGGTSDTGAYLKGNVDIGNNGSDGNAYVQTVNVESGATYNGGFSAYTNANSGSSTAINVYGDHVTTGTNPLSLNSKVGAAGVVLTYHAGSTFSGNGEFRIGNDGGSGTLNINGGNVATDSKVVISRVGGSAAVNSVVNVSSGTLNASVVQFGDNGRTYAAESSATLNVSGGILNTANGFTVPTTYANLATNVNLSGGVVGARTTTGIWTSSMNMTLSDADGGVTFRASNETDTTAKNMVLDGVLSGTGGFTKTGAGSLTLNGNNTYQGDTVISSGTLVAAAAGSLGAGDISLGAGTLTLEVATAIADTATLFFNADSLIQLNYEGEETVLAVTLTITSQSIGSGTWNATDLNEFYGGTYFSGDGLLTVTIPEPSSWLLSLSGLGAACFVRRRRAA